MGRDDAFPDEHVAELARLFRENAAWVAAARRIRPGCSGAVYFSHRPGEVWHLLREGDLTLLRRGPAPDPDLVFRFTPASIRALSRATGGVGDFAVELFSLMIDPDDERRIGLRVVSSFWTLTRRGYVRLLLESGPKVWAFGASHGFGGLASIRELVRALRAQGPADWER